MNKIHLLSMTSQIAVEVAAIMNYSDHFNFTSVSFD